MASWAAGASECRSCARVRCWAGLCYAGRSVAPRAMPRRAVRACLDGLQTHAVAMAGLYHDLEAAGSMAPVETHIRRSACVVHAHSSKPSRAGLVPSVSRRLSKDESTASTLMGTLMTKLTAKARV